MCVCIYIYIYIYMRPARDRMNPGARPPSASDIHLSNIIYINI